MATTQAEKWNEWSMKVLEELTSLNGQVENMQEKYEDLRENIEERFSKMDRQLEKINELLSGNGSPERGMVLRLDRLEQSQQTRSKTMWLLVTACATSIVGLTIKLFFGK